MTITDAINDFAERAETIAQLREQLARDIVQYDSDIEGDDNQDAFDEMVVDVAEILGYSHNVWDRDSNVEVLELWTASSC